MKKPKKPKPKYQLVATIKGDDLLLAIDRTIKRQPRATIEVKTDEGHISTKS